MRNKNIENELPNLNLPQPHFRFKEEDDILKIYDSLRGKYVAFTPEEYVRQSFTNYLMMSLHYPKSLMANEIALKVNGMNRRCDTIVFNPDGSPMVVVEYKAPDVAISQTVFDQIVRYNITLKAHYLIVSNGLRHYCAVMDYKNNTYHFIPTIPDYSVLNQPFSDN